MPDPEHTLDDTLNALSRIASALAWLATQRGDGLGSLLAQLAVDLETGLRALDHPAAL